MVGLRGYGCIGIFFLFTLALLCIPSSQGRRSRNRRTDDMDDFDLDSSLPRFASPIPNITIQVGKDCIIPCQVEHLSTYKVAWVRVDTQTILTIHQQVITRNPRISLVHSDHRSWFLQIKNVEENDRGYYMCQVNTDPMRSLMGYLEVVVPPEIIDKDTSTDMVVKEGTNVTLTCKAKGHPEPYIMWRREDNQEIQYNGQMVNVIDGDVFHITKVSRLHMGAYLCIASNGIPPSISKRVELKVQFPPMMTIPHQLEAAHVGQEVTVECQTEAYPKSINYWTDEKGNMLVSDVLSKNIPGSFREKYEALLVDSSYRMYMRLKIRNISASDFGILKCVAKNSLGETDGNIKLYEIPAPSTTTIATPITSPPAPRKHKKDKSSISNVVIDYEWNSERGSKKYEDRDRRLGMAGESSGSSSSIRIIMRSGSRPSVTRVGGICGLSQRLFEKIPSALTTLPIIQHILHTLLSICRTVTSVICFSLSEISFLTCLLLLVGHHCLQYR